MDDQGLHNQQLQNIYLIYTTLFYIIRWQSVGDTPVQFSSIPQVLVMLPTTTVPSSRQMYVAIPPNKVEVTVTLIFVSSVKLDPSGFPQLITKEIYPTSKRNN